MNALLLALLVTGSEPSFADRLQTYVSPPKAQQCGHGLRRRNGRIMGAGTPAVAAYDNTHKIVFGGSNEYVNFGDVATDGASRVVWSAVINNANCTSTETLFAKAPSSGAYEWRIDTNASTSLCNLIVHVSASLTTQERFVSAADAVPEGSAVHICISYDGSQATNATRLRAWVNGSEITSGGSYVGTIPAALPTGTADALWGNLSPGSGPTSGDSDELLIYIGEANPPSCTTLYNNGTRLDPVLLSPKPTHCWTVNGDVANTITDKCNASPLNGTMVNMEAGDIATPGL